MSPEIRLDESKGKRIYLSALPGEDSETIRATVKSVACTLSDYRDDVVRGKKDKDGRQRTFDRLIAPEFNMPRDIAESLVNAADTGENICVRFKTVFEKPGPASGPRHYEDFKIIK